LIGGRDVTVTNITPSGVEPHDFEPSPQDVVTIESARVVVMSGTAVDAWASKLQSDLVNKGVVTVVAAESVQLHSTASSSGVRGIDPHFWQDPTLMIALARSVASTFAAEDPAHARDYSDRLAAFESTMTTLDHDVEVGLETCATRQVVVSHDAFRYLGDRYALEIVPIAGISPDEEPSPQQLAKIVEDIRRRHTSTVFFEPLVSSALAQTIAAEAKVSIATLDPIEGLSAEQIREHKNYSTIMRENLSALRAALVCK
jgi:zinc transport system substrate-binding protein